MRLVSFPSPQDEAIDIASQVAQGLAKAHEQDIVHRDVKPANVLMCNKEKDGVSVKLGDFGMSTFVGVDGLVRGRCGKYFAASFDKSNTVRHSICH